MNRAAEEMQATPAVHVADWEGGLGLRSHTRRSFACFPHVLVGDSALTITASSGPLANLVPLTMTECQSNSLIATPAPYLAHALPKRATPASRATF